MYSHFINIKIQISLLTKSPVVLVQKTIGGMKLKKNNWLLMFLGYSSFHLNMIRHGRWIWDLVHLCLGIKRGSDLINYIYVYMLLLSL